MEKCNFTEKTFVDCSLVPPSVDRDFKQSRRKLSLIDTKQRNSRSFPLYGIIELLELLLGIGAESSLL